ncbi:hypothetical protein SAMN05444398_12136 [Roseovarius pacificus]|uniref:Uncharacterized protein n=1 Tax=Roseovarius pacificus TaxID=337701 RepID=A0A1M7JNV7_9RHOB|nr:hypothetical protein [Roseovarius pacificus]GGO58508.1 hypothetical protein GCM10011315_28240 [Roseovarius pacificus]SHM54666.1 hypothetical protein SAMN05444398_12136 [Roseovarius pacificus]
MAAILKMALPVAAFPVTAIPMSGGAALPTPECGAGVCTYADSTRNVFPGQMRQITDLFRDACPSSKISETGTSRA